MITYKEIVTGKTLKENITHVIIPI